MNYKYRMHDPRLGRWFSTDPVFQPHQSPYNSMDNSPSTGFISMSVLNSTLAPMLEKVPIVPGADTPSITTGVVQGILNGWEDEKK